MSGCGFFVCQAKFPSFCGLKALNSTEHPVYIPDSVICGSCHLWTRLFEKNGLDVKSASDLLTVTSLKMVSLPQRVSVKCSARRQACTKVSV